MQPASSTAAAPARVLPLAPTATHVLVTEYDRQLKGFGWKQPIFDLFRKLAHFLDTKLHLPTIIHHDKKGDFTIDRCGTFDNRYLAERAIESLKRECVAQGRPWVYFEWVDMPHNGTYPSFPGRYGDGDFVGLETDVFLKANHVVRCQYHGKLCNPSEMVGLQRRHVSRVAGESQRVLEKAKSLAQLL